MAITAGCRFYLYGGKAMISTPGEWAYAPPQLLLKPTSAGAPPAVRVPAASVVVWLRGEANNPVRNVSFQGLTFADADFDAQGGQEGFDAKDWPPAMPSDAALRISDTIGARVQHCTFSHLGGGGIHIGNRSSAVHVLDSRFVATGQSGVILTGTSKTQPWDVLVEGCDFASPGTILSSAAGILASTTSRSTFRRNVVTNSSRWGIAIRSNGKTAMSVGNTIELNRVEGAGQATRDLGGISLIGAGHTGTSIRSNCIKDVIGTDTNPSGELLRPFFTWSVYLDNDASGFMVEGNVLNGNVNGGVFFHGGRDNVVRNNILAGTSGAAGGASQPGDYGWFHAGSVVFRNFGASVGTNNSFVRNVVLASANQSVWDLVDPVHNHPLPLTTVSSNLYYSAMQHLATMTADRTGQPPFHWVNAQEAGWANGTWDSWRSMSNVSSGALIGWDEGSFVDVDPGFVDALSGDFRLRGPDAMARKLVGFEEIDARVLPC